MAKRWQPRRMRVVWDNLFYDWVAVNENGDAARFAKHEHAMRWVWGNWSHCNCCGNYSPFHPEHDVCRNCGCRVDDRNSYYRDMVSRLADHLMYFNYPLDRDQAEWDEQRGNYLLDAEDVIALLPHLLPLDIREAMFDETEEEA